MIKINAILFSLLFVAPVFAQKETPEAPESQKKSDTTTIKLRNRKVVITEKDDDFNIEFDENGNKKSKKEKDRAHWSGLDFGFTMLMDDNYGIKHPENPYWENDAARSQVWNLNLLQHKFKFGTPYVGLTTGLGFSFASVSFNDNYVLRTTSDTLYAEIDSLSVYSKNKLKASYLTVPLLLEFSTSVNRDKSFYFAAGVIGGVRLTSKIKRKGTLDGKDFEEKDKGTYGLNSFKLDAALRIGYSNWGVFANYNLIPLFDTNKTVEVHPLTFGLSFTI